MKNKPRIAFFGTPSIATAVLDALKAANLSPDLIVTNPDRPQGRSLSLTPPPAKVWALTHDIPVLQPIRPSEEHVLTLKKHEWDLFVVVAYGALIPKALLEIPIHGTLNMHPSLLPKLRGPSPIRSAILNDIRETGVSIMLMDEELDHGPILAQEQVAISESSWPLPGGELDTLLAERGGALLAETIPKWLSGTVTPVTQDHDAATYTKKITKDMGELKIDPYALPNGTKAYDLLLKIRAFDGWPGTFFFHSEKRIKIIRAELDEEGTLRIMRIVPEGKQEMDFDAYFPQV